jgi:hypothetical protein
MHSTLSQTCLTADPAASSNDAFNASTFSAAAAASDGRTVAGSAVVTSAVSDTGEAIAGSETIRNTGSVTACLFGMRPCRKLPASTVSSSFV